MAASENNEQQQLSEGFTTILPSASTAVENLLFEDGTNSQFWKLEL